MLKISCVKADVISKKPQRMWKTPPSPTAFRVSNLYEHSYKHRYDYMGTRIKPSNTEGLQLTSHVFPE